MFENKTIAQVDPELWGFIQDEQRRQEDHIELIASENYTSPAVMQAQGSCLTNKYAEGYPGHRYYGGCENVDSVERLAIARAKALFCEPLGVDMMVNVQPHSGAQANMAAFMAVLQPGDTVMGMSLADGGHLSHGMRLNYSGRYFRVVSYGLKQDETIDYDEVERLALEHKPKLIVAGASAYSLKIDFERFAQIAHKVGALLMADIAHYAALVAGGVYPTPFGFADIVTTTTHKSLRGPRGGVIFARPELEKAINSAVFPGTQGGPLMHIIAAKAVAFEEALKPEFILYQQQVIKNAQVLADELKKLGYKLVSGGTDNHLMLVDVKSSVGLTGKYAEKVLCSLNITCNKNTIPNDSEKPMISSGIRLGTPALTTRGMKEKEMIAIAHLIDKALRNHDNEELKQQVKEEVLLLTSKFPL